MGKSATAVTVDQQLELLKSQKTNYCSWTPPSQVSSYSQILHLYSMKKTTKQIAITLHVCTLPGFNSLIFLKGLHQTDGTLCDIYLPAAQHD